MPFIEMMSRDGTSVVTDHVVGSRMETKYFRVMTEDFGKLFFPSKKEYMMWLKKGRPHDGIVVERGGVEGAARGTDADEEWHAAAEEYRAMMHQLESDQRVVPENDADDGGENDDGIGANTGGDALSEEMQ